MLNPDFWDSFGKARDKARKNHYKCLYPGCSKVTCDCHLVQQHPFVASIAEDGRVYQIKDNVVNPMSGDFSDLKENLLPVKQALILPLFCSEHDNALFKDIEYGDIDFESANTFLLFSYRGLAGQRFLEEKRQTFYQNTGFEGWAFDLQREYSKHVIERLDCTLNQMLKDIQNKSYDEYEFCMIDFPFLAFCGSDAVVDEDEMAYSYDGGKREVRPLNALFFTLLPMAESKVLKVIIGYHKGYVGAKQKAFYHRVLKLRNAKTTMELICRMKNWCCSPSLIKNKDFLTQYEVVRNEIIWDGGC